MRIGFAITAAWLAVAACDHSGVVLRSGDGGVDGAHPTSLDGPVACGTTMCGSGELCVEQESGIANDAGVGTITTSCIAVGSGCVVADCDGSACPTCIAELCAYYPSFNDPTLAGRILTCPGE